jgi:hypothetical protein
MKDVMKFDLLPRSRRAAANSDPEQAKGAAAGLISFLSVFGAAPFPPATLKHHSPAAVNNAGFPDEYTGHNGCAVLGFISANIPICSTTVFFTAFEHHEDPTALRPD